MNYLNEVKFRNQVRRDLAGLVSVANKSDRYGAMGYRYAHIETTSQSQDGWFSVRYQGKHWDIVKFAHESARTQLLIAQTLHSLGYEVKLVEQRVMFGEGTEKVAHYRKAGN
jgi:hypothetical protein